MTAATITEYLDVADPTKEVVILECTDGETYLPRKFKIPKAAFAAWLVDTDGYINTTINSTTGVVTINAAGASDSAIVLELIGGKKS